MQQPRSQHGPGHGSPDLTPPLPAMVGRVGSVIDPQASDPGMHADRSYVIRRGVDDQRGPRPRHRIAPLMSVTRWSDGVSPCRWPRPVSVHVRNADLRVSSPCACCQGESGPPIQGGTHSPSGKWRRSCREQIPEVRAIVLHRRWLTERRGRPDGLRIIRCGASFSPPAIISTARQPEHECQPQNVSFHSISM